MSIMMVQTKCKLNITELFIPQTVPYSMQRNWKQQVLRRNNRTRKMAKRDFA